MSIYLYGNASSSLPPHQEGILVGDGLHSIYWSESGNPAGIPVLVIRGFGFWQAAASRCFDFGFYRVVRIDLRGTGRSSPLGEPWDNTLFAVIEDIEQLRKTLKIDKWLVAGTAWGTTFALAYGESCPDSCLGFVLCGVFLGKKSEREWLFEAGTRFFPRAYEEFTSWIKAPDRDNALRAYEMALFSSDKSLQVLTAKRWQRYLATCSRLDPAAPIDEHARNSDEDAMNVAQTGRSLLHP